MKKHELFTVPQEERVKTLEATVIPWMNDLAPDERLVIGLPVVLGKWESCTPLIVGPGMQEQFLSWLGENAEFICGPHYNLPKLNTYFLCLVIDENFDPRLQEPPEEASEELKGVLLTLGHFLTENESQAA